MAIGLVGEKCGMTQVFNEAGLAVPVTVIRVEPNRLTQIKTLDRDGYRAIQVTIGAARPTRLTKALKGHYAKANVEPGRGLWEFPLEDDEGLQLELGQSLQVDLFTAGQKVDVIGITKGKGFAGGVKRHHFRTQDASHGNSVSHRAPGSIGQRQSPGRVFKGKRMAGQLGNKQRTIQSQMVYRVDLEKQLILIKGAVPGAPGGIVLIKPAVKHRLVKSAA